ncbi:fructose-1-6-bisphosphatase [Biscogniauxia mediterranea]|nr:fructose-1-6-bisphosphatase [Biscogniauxia mediterranea]
MSIHSSRGSPELLHHLRAAVGPSADAHTQLIESVIPGLIDSIGTIAVALRKAHHVSRAGSANAFGDDQLNVDVLAEQAVRDAVANCPAVVTASSEEDPVERPALPRTSAPAPRKENDDKAGGEEEEGEHYTVAFDPLDGSSIIAPNWTVGTIVGVWQGRTALRQDPAARQVAAVLGVYGPRTTVVVALRVPGRAPACLELGLNERGAEDCTVVRAQVRLGSGAGAMKSTRYFAPANLRAASEDARYMDLVSRFVRERYTLRYSGGLVPDVVHSLVKGHGVYVSPVTAGSKAKLRRLFELYPIALVMECAGGKAISPADGSRILDRALEDLNETAGLVCGTAEDVEIVRAALVG